MTRSTAPEPPLTRHYDLSGLSEAGDEVAIIAKPDDLPRLAKWLGVDAMTSFDATVTPRRLGANRFLYEATLNADIVQTCVASLKPVKSHFDAQISRVLHLAGRRRHGTPASETVGTITLSVDEEDGPEEIDSPRYDLAAPLLEELLLRIDPYPRAESVEFESPPEAAEAKENPFGVLKQLKDRG